MVSTVTPSITEPPAAAGTGASLRAARERLNVSLQDVAADLRIRLPYLEALEDGRIAALPGRTYALAFVRTYANALGLDAEEVVRRFRTEVARFDLPTALDFPAPVPEHGLPAGAMILLGLILAVGAYAGWYHLSGDGRLPAETTAPIPERLASLAEQALPAMPSPSVPTAARPRVETADPAASEHIAADPMPPAMAISPSSAAAAQPPPQPPDPLAVSSSAPATMVVDTSRIVLRASLDSWILVKDRSGIVLLNRTMKAGETWPVPPRPDLLLTTGNAGGTEVVVDGATTPSLGGGGAVRRDLPLDPDKIKEGKLASAAIAPLASTRPRQ